MVFLGKKQIKFDKNYMSLIIKCSLGNKIQIQNYEFELSFTYSKNLISFHNRNGFVFNINSQASRVLAACEQLDAPHHRRALHAVYFQQLLNHQDTGDPLHTPLLS